MIFGKNLLNSHKMTPKQAAKKIMNLNLSANEIRSFFDELGTSDEMLDAVLYSYGDKLNDMNFIPVADIIDDVDCCAADEKIIRSRMDDILLKNFLRLFMSLKLSRQEIIFFLKNDFVSDDDIIFCFNSMKSQDLMDGISRWKPGIISKIEQKIEEYKFSSTRIKKFSMRMNGGIKFKFLSGGQDE